jgi:hypothetical protein
MIKDPEFIAEIEKSGQEFLPSSGGQLEKLVQEVSSAARETVERVEAILRAK